MKQFFPPSSAIDSGQINEPVSPGSFLLMTSSVPLPGMILAGASYKKKGHLRAPLFLFTHAREY